MAWDLGSTTTTNDASWTARPLQYFRWVRFWLFYLVLLSFCCSFYLFLFLNRLSLSLFLWAKTRGEGRPASGTSLVLTIGWGLYVGFQNDKVTLKPRPSNWGRFGCEMQRLLRELDARDHVSFSASEIFSVKWGSAVWNYSSGTDLWLWMMIMEWGSVLWKIWQEWWHWNHIGIY